MVSEKVVHSHQKVDLAWKKWDLRAPGLFEKALKTRSPRQKVGVFPSNSYRCPSKSENKPLIPKMSHMFSHPTTI
jgi:hypothetical protein